MDEIHKAQKYIVEYGSRKQKKYDKYVRTMKEELRILAPTLAKIQDFPFADRIEDIASVVKDIREGKIEMKDLKGRSYTKILSKIQDLQKKSLIDYQKQYMRDHF